jgi:hypothetical protein
MLLQDKHFVGLVVQLPHGTVQLVQVNAYVL